jgi:hypothetical protein
MVEQNMITVSLLNAWPGDHCWTTFSFSQDGLGNVTVVCDYEGSCDDDDEVNGEDNVVVMQWEQRLPQVSQVSVLPPYMLIRAS